MFRTTLLVVCGWVVALAVGASASADNGYSPADAAAHSAPPEPELRACYWACDVWMLYPTWEQCAESCPDPCERSCF